MSRLKVADFYYGAVLSILFNNGLKPALIEGNNDRQVYDLTTNKGECRLFIKYRACKQDTKKSDYYSWVFNISAEGEELQEYMENEYNLVLALVCGSENLTESEIALLDKEQITEILNHKKTSITISRKKGEKAFRIPTDSGRATGIKIKSNRFEELFK